MPSDGSDAKERRFPDEGEAWLETMNANGSNDFWRRLLKDTGLGVIALLCLLSYVYWPQPWVVVVGVAVIVSMAWLSELGSYDRQLPADNRSVVITGCDTGNIMFNHSVWHIHLPS